MAQFNLRPAQGNGSFDCFRSSAPLPLRGWIVPVGGATPDRHKDDRHGTVQPPTSIRSGFAFFSGLVYNEGMKTFRVACVQMESGDDFADNLNRARNLLRQGAEMGAEVAALPEFFTMLSADEGAKLKVAENPGDGPAQKLLSETAAEFKMFVLGGTIPLRASGEDGRVYAASILYGPDGSVVARYDKIHLFQFAGARRTYDEARSIVPGSPTAENIVVAETPLGRFGLSVCYDLRFAELYRAMKAPDVVFAPSAFTRETGAAHWELLLRARAVENLCHVVAPAQGGTHPGGRGTHGNSMIVGPWGDILARAPDSGDAVVCAELQADEREMMRARLPCLQNRKLP